MYRSLFGHEPIGLERKRLALKITSVTPYGSAQVASNELAGEANVREKQTGELKINTKNKSLIVVILAIAIQVFANAPLAHSQCSDNEYTAVFVVSGIYPGTNLQLDLLSVIPVGESTYPSDEEITATIAALQPSYMYQQTEFIEQSGHFYQYFQDPGDFGSVALVDSRDGAIVFAAPVIWMGSQEINTPSQSTHEWNLDPLFEATPPQSIEIMSNLYWVDHEGWQSIYGTPEGITNSAIEFLRQTDVLFSFGQCGPYEVVSYIYTPWVGNTWPDLAKCIIVVNGKCSPPWSDGAVAVEAQSWGSVKALFR